MNRATAAVSTAVTTLLEDPVNPNAAAPVARDAAAGVDPAGKPNLLVFGRVGGGKSHRGVLAGLLEQGTAGSDVTAVPAASVAPEGGAA